MTIEEANFQAADGVALHGWYVPHRKPKAAVLFLHGNGGNITHRTEILRALHARAGVSVLIFDYRGYGHSKGKPSERGILADARAARDWLARREKIRPADVVLMGESLGGGGGGRFGREGRRPALVLESTFTSLPDVAAYHYRWLPVRLLMRTRLDSLAKIAAYHGPLFQSHGDVDTIIPFAIGRRLFEAANEPKQFMTISGRDHNDPRPPGYYDALAEFFAGL